MTSISTINNTNTSTGGLNHFPLIQITNSNSGRVNSFQQQQIEPNYDFIETGVIQANTTPFLDSNNFTTQHQQSQLPVNEFFNKYYSHNHHIQYNNGESTTIYQHSYAPKTTSANTNILYPMQNNYLLPNNASQNQHSVYLYKTADYPDILPNSTNTNSNGLYRYEANASTTHNDSLKFPSNNFNFDYSNNLGLGSLKTDDDLKKLNKRSFVHYGDKVTNENEVVDSSMSINQDKFKAKVTTSKNVCASNNSMFDFASFYCFESLIENFFTGYV
jgi:hypothetical protein